MNYRHFLKQAAEEIEKKLLEQRVACEVTVTEVEKLQNQSYQGILIRTKGKNIGANLNLMPYWQRLENGFSYQQIIGEIVLESLSMLEEIPDLEAGIPLTYEEVKNRLMFQIVSSEDNQKVLAGLPHLELEDMSIVFRVDMGAEPDGNTSAPVTNDMMEYYGVTLDQLKEDTEKVAPVTHPAVFRRLDLILKELSGGLFPEEESEKYPIYVVSTEAMNYGAAVICYPGFLQEAAEKLESDYFLLLSSIHEMILIKDDGNMNAEELSQMVREVNETEVKTEDKLTDSVYFYNRKKQLLKRVE